MTGVEILLPLGCGLVAAVLVAASSPLWLPLGRGLAGLLFRQERRSLKRGEAATRKIRRR